MKKFLSVVLVLVMMLSTLGITASAKAEPFVPCGFYDAVIDDICYYFTEENGTWEAYVSGYVVDEKDYTPAGDVTIPETVTYDNQNFVVAGVESQAFYESRFTSVTLPSTINYMGDGAFSDSGYLKNVVIPDDCYFTYFGDSVFTNTPYESSLYATDEKIIGKNVLFSYIGYADEYVIPDNIDLIAPNAFFMSGLKSVVFNDSITEIPYCAFASCRNLTSVSFPDNVEYIAQGAFKDCTKLETVDFGNGVSALGLDSFANTGVKSIHIGQNLYQIAGAFRNCKALETITIDSSNTILTTDGNAVYMSTEFYFDGAASGRILEYYIPSKVPSSLALPSDVMMIGAYAFYGCKGIKELSASMIAIDSYAFANSSIEKVDANIFYILDSAFLNCSNLKDIRITATSYIGISAFENCTALTSVEFSEGIGSIGELAFANTGLTNVTIYGNDCYIYESAFKGCKNLTSVRLEEGVSYVGTNAFLNCPKLETIYLSKTVKYFDDNTFNGCDNVTFEVLRNSDAYKFIKNNTDLDYEIVGRYSLFQRIIDFFRALFGLD